MWRDYLHLPFHIPLGQNKSQEGTVHGGSLHATQGQEASQSNGQASLIFHRHTLKVFNTHCLLDPLPIKYQTEKLILLPLLGHWGKNNLLCALKSSLDKQYQN